MIEYTLIQSDEALAEACRELELNVRIAVDLEADSLHHFREKVCLIQISDGNRNILVDPFSITDITPFQRLCESPDITKVFHGADFDIRSLQRDFGIRINSLFDTEIACRFLGIQKRSLAALLNKHFGLCLDKRFQKTDWSKRPLSEEMIAYSVSDVSHLLALADILEKRLAELKRLDWAEEECRLQTLVAHDTDNHDPLFMKFKGAGKMSRRTLAVLEALLRLRMEIAEKKDLPLFKVMGADAVSRMASEKPVTLQALKKTGALSPKQTGMYGGQCIQAIQEGLALPGPELPVYPRRRSPERSPEIPVRIKALKELRGELSRKTGIEPGFLINNAMITSVAVTPPRDTRALASMDGIRQWQVEAVGDDIINTLKICA